MLGRESEAHPALWLYLALAPEGELSESNGSSHQIKVINR